MCPTIRERLSHNARDVLVGRRAELSQLRGVLSEATPAVVHLHGLSGIGKSTLLTAFAEEAREAGATVLAVDCGNTEPTERGVLQELGGILDCPPQLHAVATALAACASPALLAFDAYESFQLIDAWIRQRLIPDLPERTLILLASRLPPASAWTEGPAWQGLFRAMQLAPLSAAEATALLAQLAAPQNAVAKIVSFAAGHPLALTLAARAALSPLPSAQPLEIVIPQLASRYLGQIGDVDTREALRAVSVARRISIGLLRNLLPDADPAALYQCLAALPFVTPARDGLEIHTAVRLAVAAELESSDPERHRKYRQQAWRHLTQQSAATPGAELWRYTADLIYLIRNPVIREAFFPGELASFAVEPAQPSDHSAILAIARKHDGTVGAGLMADWLHAAPHAFFAIRSPECAVESFYCLLDAGDPATDKLRADPVTARFLCDVAQRPLADGQTALLLRRWLSHEDGERPSAAQAACWLDIKRHYMERRPHLRRVYMALADLQPYAGVAGALGIVPLGNPAPVGNHAMQPALLDMGPGSVDGWLSRLAAAELGIAAQEDLLDAEKRALRIDGRFVRLTRREFDVMAYVVARPGAAVSRDRLIHDVWGLRFDAGSNVVDAIIASLRRKLGSRAGAIETVRGYGYLYRAGADIAPPGAGP